MRDLPRSVFATPGMRGIGDAGRVDADDDNFGGLRKVYAASTAHSSKWRTPCIGHVTVPLKGGAGFHRGAFLALSQLVENDNPDCCAVYGFWILDKEDMLSGKYINYQQLINPKHGDSDSKRVFEAMDNDACFLALDWPDTVGFTMFEPTARVIKNGDQMSDDLDEIKLASIQRIHPYKKTGWRRLQLIEELIGPAWTMTGLINLIREFDERSVSYIPEMEPRPPSGLVPNSPSFEPVLPDVMLINGIAYARAHTHTPVA